MRAEPLLTAVCVLAAAASAETLEVRATPRRATVGDHVEVVVSAPGARRWKTLEVRVAQDGPWAVLKKPRPLGSGSWRFELAPLEVGPVPLPELVAVAEDGHEVRWDNGLTVEVASVLPSGDNRVEPAPLRDPVGVRGLPWEWVPPFVLLALPVAGGVWLWRRRRGGGGARAQEKRDPLAELEAVLAGVRRDIGEVPAVEVCDRLAAALRRFLERELEAPVAEMTRLEIAELARRQRWPEVAVRGILRALETADRVRFARAAVTRAELEGAVGAARDAARVFDAWRTGAEEAA